MMIEGYKQIMFMFWYVLQVFWNTVIDVFMFVATTLFLKDTKNPLKGPPEAAFTPRRIVYRTVSLDDIKLVKNEMNAAGLSRYINRICGQIFLPASCSLWVKQEILSDSFSSLLGGNKKDGGAIEMNNLPMNIRLRSTLLINIRPSAGIQALADMMEKDAEAKWGNWIGYVLLPFTIAIRVDPLDYVRDAKAIIDRKKRSLEAIYTFSIAELALKLFGIKV
ncbi:hypothetical protein REPUB_Repub11eG0096900 [Reevesia pubescens]